MKSFLKISLNGGLIATIFIFFCLLTELHASAEKIDFRVDASKEMGKVPEILSGSVWLGNARESNQTMVENFFRENMPVVIQMNIPLGGVNLEGFKDELSDYIDSDNVTNILKLINKRDITLIIGFDPCPVREWLSSYPGRKESPVVDPSLTIESCSPPRDYALWGQVVKYALKQFRDRGVGRLGFYVGHEPDWNWLGTEEELFKYYKAAADAAKSVNPRILIGGIGTSAVTARKHACKDYGNPAATRLCTKGAWTRENKSPVLENFIRKVAAGKVPLDFINWHSFGALPPEFMVGAGTVKGWLKDAGLDDKKVRLYPADWTYWAGEYPADYLDTQESASYIVSALFYMWKADIDWHGHDFNVYGFEGKEETLLKERQNSTFIGDWGIITRGGNIGGGVIKPTYNALKAINKVARENTGEPRRLIATEHIADIAAMSTLSNDRKRVFTIVSNFVPQSGPKMRKFIAETARNQLDLSEAEINIFRECIQKGKSAIGKKRDIFWSCKERLIGALKEPNKIEAVELISKVYVCLTEKKGPGCMSEASAGLKYPENQKIADSFGYMLDSDGEERLFQVHFSNIPFTGQARLKIYSIDNGNSNACALNKRTEPKMSRTTCGIGGVVDQAVWKSKEDAKIEGLKAAGRLLSSDGYTDKQVAFIKGRVEKCSSAGDRKECMKRAIMDLKRSYNISHSGEKIQGDLQKAVAEFRETFNNFYHSQIARINSWKEIALEGSEKSEAVNIIDNRYTLNFSMEPNSVKIVVLSMDGE